MDPELVDASGRLPLWLVVLAVPLVLATATAFTKSSVVLAALRTGLGADALIPGPALLAIALVVTAVVMGPTAIATWDAVEALGGWDAVLSGSVAAWDPVLAPLGEFVARHADPDEIAFFAELSGLPPDHLLAQVPAFLVTELGEAFQMAVLIIVPFVVVDLLVAQALALLGLPQMPVALVSTPLKLLLFLAAGGWDVVIGGIAGGYA